MDLYFWRKASIFRIRNLRITSSNGLHRYSSTPISYPFRDAHGIVGQLVLKCIDRGISLDELSLEEYKEISPVFEQDIYEAISMKTCVEKRITLGAPGPDVMEKVIAGNKKYLEEN